MHSHHLCIELSQREAGLACGTYAGGIDREKLGELVFTDNKARKKLNAATHLPVALDLAKQLIIQWFSFTNIIVRSIKIGFTAFGVRSSCQQVSAADCRWSTCPCCLRLLLTNSCGPGLLLLAVIKQR